MLKEIAGFNSTLATPINTLALAISLPNGDGEDINALLGPAGWAYFLLVSSQAAELVKVSALSGSQLSILRAQEGSSAQNFPAGSIVRYVVGINAVEDKVLELGAAGVQVVAATGIATSVPVVQGFSVGVLPPVFTSSSLVITGTWPAIDFELPALPPVAPGINSIDFSGEFAVSGAISDPIVGLQLSGAAGSHGLLLGSGVITGMTVSLGGRVTAVATAELPNGTYNNPQVVVTDGRISVISAGTSVATLGFAAGLFNAGTVTDPVVSLTTLITAGTYGGLGINAQGRITSATGFNPVTSVTAGSSKVTVTGGPNPIVDIQDASTSVAGAVQLATPSEAVDPNSISRALTPSALWSGLTAGGYRLASAVISTPPLAQVTTSTVLATATVAVPVNGFSIIFATVQTAAPAIFEIVAGSLQVKAISCDSGSSFMAIVNNFSGIVQLRSNNATATGCLDILSFANP